MKKTIISLVALCSIGLCCLAGCDSGSGSTEGSPTEGSSSGSGFAISNKDELQEEWHINDSTRQIEFTCDDEEFNVSALISSGDLTVESSDTDVVGVSGTYLYPLGEGTSTITAKYGEEKDSVDITVEAAPALPYELGKEYYLAEDVSGITYYFTGNQVSDYTYEGEMKTSLSTAVKVTLSEAEGDDAYYMTYTKDSTTYYVCIIEVDGYQDLQLVTTPTPIYYYASNDAWVNAQATYYLGWHSTYHCLFASSISGINTYQHAYLLDPNDATEYTPTLATPVTSVSSGTSYYLGIVLDNIQYYFNGSIKSNYYLDVTTDIGQAVAVTLTSVNDSNVASYDTGETSDGYTITFTKNSATQTFYAYYNGTNYTCIFGTSVPSTGGGYTDVTTTFVWNSTINGLQVTLNSTVCTLGLQSTSTYQEIALVYGSNPIVAQLYAVE
ncbi:MAG: hypothetical protein LUC31_01165 [Coprobacillus sp.]|nr:hypothetical protein [Coprobacillus sp.]